MGCNVLAGILLVSSLKNAEFCQTISQPGRAGLRPGGPMDDGAGLQRLGQVGRAAGRSA